MSKMRDPDRSEKNNTSRKSLINMEILEKHYRTLLTESKPIY